MNMTLREKFQSFPHSTDSMKTIAYFAGARSGSDPRFEEAALAVGRFCGRHACLAKYGASRHGLMGAFALGFKEAAEESRSGGKLFGVVPEKFAKINQPETMGIEFLLTKDLTERKHHLLEKVDAFLVLPGGTGTLDEIFEVTEQDYLPADRDPSFTDYAIRPIYILNLNGYYDHTIAQFQRMMDEGFLIPQKIAAIHFYNTLDEYLKALERFFEA